MERANGAGRRRGGLLWAVAAWGGLLWACGAGTAPPPPAGSGSGDAGAPGAPRAPFVDRAAQAGLDFVHFNGMSGELYVVENIGAGAALLDADGDGDLDLFLVQGTMLGERPVREATFPPTGPPGDRLYRNDLEVAADGSRRPRFVDITAGAGLGKAGYGMGVATGDYDGDGRVDLYLTRFGPNRLLRNRSGGGFADATAESGSDDRRWSVPAVFFDYDRDGWLDLFVGNYLDFRLATHRPCKSASGARDYCAPEVYGPVPDRLLHNRGDGTFEEVTARAGLDAAYGRALGAVAADFDGDGWLDLYVADDGSPNQLWRNRGDGTFEEVALLAGCAVNGAGLSEASMGVDAGDFDGDGDLDLVVSHLTGESHTLYASDGRGAFTDVTAQAGLAAPSWGMTGFGAGWIDFDADGRLDLLTVDGAVRTIEEEARSGDPYPLRQTDQLFHNRGDGGFDEVSAAAGEAFAVAGVSRGAALGDLDDDGDVDVVVTQNSGPVRLLLSQVEQGGRWIGLRVVEDEPPRDALGALVEVLPAGAPPQLRRVATDGSYASARDPRVVVSLGTATAVAAVRVRWPDGAWESWTGLETGGYTTLRRGTGRPGRR